ncbi:DUF1236 domain-containing protein [Microvirga splendida]|uniref:DUF1236 domain-containing protein n=1 Tax=Microvirga splendida TaxID=2795727 RepID=A0ABS0Y154_9HYPH|nr:DUF1236 domain-containing protein [Microvirga splendida]MBJ6126043.1 DUF1236 domain-containing protein [Microvirga splendida]
MKSFVIATAAAIGLLAAVPAGAQTSVTTTTTETTGSVTIAPEKRTIIRQQLGSSAPATIKEKVTVGAMVPDTVELRTVPETIVSEVPSVKGHRYFVYNDNVVLVDPKTRKVVTIVE